MGSRYASEGLFGSSIYRLTWSQANTSIGGGAYQNFNSDAGRQYTASAYIRPSKNQKIRAAIEWKDQEGTNISISQNAPEDFVANTWRRISITGTPPEGSIRGVVTFFVGNGGSLWAPGDTMDVDGFLLEQSSGPLDFFDGSDSDAIWLGAAGNSASAKLVSSSPQQILSHQGRYDGLTINGKNITFRMEFDGQPSAEISYDLGENRLAHVVGLFNGNDLELWVNGSAVGSVTLTDEQKAAPYLASDGKLYGGTTTSSQRIAVNAVAVYNLISGDNIVRNYQAGIETIGQARIPVQKSGVPVGIEPDIDTIIYEKTWSEYDDFTLGRREEVEFTPQSVVPAYDESGLSKAGYWSVGIPLDATGDTSIYGVALSWSGSGISVQASTDGVEFTDVKNGELVSIIPNGFNPTGKDLEVRVNFAGGKVDDPSFLESLSTVVFKNNKTNNITAFPITIGHPAVIRKDYEVNLFRDDNGVTLNGGSITIGPDTNPVPEPIRTIELWVKPTGTFSISGITGTRYRNGVVDSVLPLGQWSVIHIVSAGDVTSNIVISGNAIVGQLSVYDTSLTAADITHIYRSYNGTTAVRIEESNGITVTEPVGPVIIYNHDWSITGAG